MPHKVVRKDNKKNGASHSNATMPTAMSVSTHISIASQMLSPLEIYDAIQAVHDDDQISDSDLIGSADPRVVKALGRADMWRDYFLPVDQGNTSFATQYLGVILSPTYGKVPEYLIRVLLCEIHDCFGFIQKQVVLTSGPTARLLKRICNGRLHNACDQVRFAPVYGRRRAKPSEIAASLAKRQDPDDSDAWEHPLTGETGTSVGSPGK